MIMNGNTPTLISGVPKRASSRATTRSHASASPSAPASTCPLAAHSVGLPSSPIRRNRRGNFDDRLQVLLDQGHLRREAGEVRRPTRRPCRAWRSARRSAPPRPCARPRTPRADRRAPRPRARCASPAGRARASRRARPPRSEPSRVSCQRGTLTGPRARGSRYIPANTRGVEAPRRSLRRGT